MGSCQAYIATRGCAWFDAIFRLGVGVRKAFELLNPSVRSLHCYLISMDTYLALTCSLNDVNYIKNLHISKYCIYLDHHHANCVSMLTNEGMQTCGKYQWL